MNLSRFFERAFPQLIPRSFKPAPVLTKMEKVFVRCVDGEENMTISFRHRDKYSSLNRSQVEVVEKSLARIQCTLKKHFEKEMKKRKKMKIDSGSTASNQGKTQTESEISVGLFVNNVPVTCSMPNKSVWIDGAVLDIEETKFRVCKNFPKVLRVHLPTFSLVGCPVFPRISLDFAEEADCKFKWFRTVREAVDSAIAMEVDEKTAQSQTETGGTCCWVEVGQEKIYIPTMADVGSKLKFVCFPRDGEKEGEAKDVITMREVKHGPKMFPFEKRHAYTSERTSDKCFRLISYNILADLYADSDYSRDYLYPYCPATALDIDYREQLLLKEISGYNADIICLQECGKKLFQYALEPALRDNDLEGLLFCKARETPEGEALFYRADKFRLVEQHDVSLAKAFETDPINKDLCAAVSKSPAMLKQVITRTSVVQVAILEQLSSPGHRLCVANTHLYFHPRAGHIRLIQTAVIMRHLEKIRETYADANPGSSLAVVFCGDLNSDPATPGVYELLSKRCIAANHVQWYCGGKEEFCGGLCLSHSLQLTNACTSQKYTNFVAGFTASLDYILVDSQHLQVEREIPMPSHDDVISHVALPNEVFPSDHLAIGCDIRWKDKTVK